MANLYMQLANFLDRDQILDSRLYREIYSRDASYFNIKPQYIVRPRTVEQIERILAIARASGTAVTFRTGGTSLSGQTVGPGIICELRTEWRRYEIRDNASKIWFEPGLTASQINAYLHPHHVHIGPDPASSSAAMMGGILSNNSSGMSAGVTYNSYHTLSAIEFILVNGHRYNSGSEADRKRFERDEHELCKGLMEIRNEILADPETRDKIVRKYKIKNVTGYGMNAFVDYDNPMDIFSHVLIGSEGTLAYIVSGELETFPLDNVYSSAMLYFSDVTTAASHAKWLGDSGARCVEMMDYASLRSYLGQNLDMPKGTTVLLVDYGAQSSEEMADIALRLTPEFKKLNGLTRMDDFTHSVDEREALWRMRNGIFPCVAGVRTPGATVILEDVVSPVEQLDRLTEGVQNLFHKYDYDGAIFGHARDGNIHPLLTTLVTEGKELDRFKFFMEDFVEHVLSLEGSLKGEHGTGRAIAPFVAREWGDKIYGMMKRLKRLADPQNLLNPGVIINDDPEAYLHPMKLMPLFGDKLGYDTADKCMECGYCEHVCPTRESTLTPRQRLQALRVMASHPDDKGLKKEYRYVGEETCCADSSCQLPCPMGISTAIVTDRVRDLTISSLMKTALKASANHYAGVESTIRTMLRTAVATEKIISPYPLVWATDLMHFISSKVPHWSKHFPMPAKLHFREEADPDYIYFPACVSRIFGASSLGKDDLVSTVLRVADRAGVKVAVPEETYGLCCSQIWDHKGDPEGKVIAANKTVAAFYEMSHEGKVPIFCDTTSCSHTLLTMLADSLTPQNKEKYAKLKIIDITTWLDEAILPKAKNINRKGSVLLHPTCASRLLGLEKTMRRIAEQCADEVVVPIDTQCCGAAGDRGFIYPEIARRATRDERDEIAGREFDGCYSLARTCEISMMDTMDRPFESIVYLVDETIS